MKDKLVTLAIRTYQRAQQIKALLTNHGIKTEIHNLNLDNPEMAVGVRVRIKESDLPQALKIVESMEREWEAENPKAEAKTILIPIDFADMVEKTVDFGFLFAKKMNAEIEFLFIYYIPPFTINNTNEISTYSITDNDMLRRIVSTANADADNLKNRINKRIDTGELPNVKFNIELKQGVPDETIPEYCKKTKPDLIIMGTQGRRLSNELLGSVTAEVIDTCSSPVFAIPSLSKKDSIKRIGFLTNFDQKDLIAIDKTISLFTAEKPELYFIHAADKSDAWSEVMLAGIKSYFSNHYPELNANYSLIASDDSAELIESFLQENQIDLLAFNTRKRRLFSRLFNPGLAYKMILHSNTMLFVTHV